MKVDYQLEPADFLALAEERKRFAPTSLSRLYYYGILPALGVGLAVATQSFPTAAVFTILFVASGWFVQNRIKREYKRTVYTHENLSFSARRWTAIVADDGLHISSDAAELLYRWPHIQRVFRGTRFVHIELTPLQKTHIPIRAFRDEQHIQGFVSEAQSHLQISAD